MKLLRAEPAAGIVWIRQAFQVFLQQPFGLAGLFSLCALVAYAVSWIPVVGGALLPVLAPAASPTTAPRRWWKPTRACARWRAPRSGSCRQ